MTERGQLVTKATYEDPELIRGYIDVQENNPEMETRILEFAGSLPGNRVIDIGCGPGFDTNAFVRNGFDAVGVDYSEAFIAEAEKRATAPENPKFMHLDMREVGNEFPEDSFDGAWISASLIHIPEEDVPIVLQGVHKIVVRGGKVFIGMKGGDQGAEVVEDTKYGKPVLREFIFWDRKNFQTVVEENGFRVDTVTESEVGVTGIKPTHWLNFYLEVVK